jgi:hypothetical protein
VGEFGIEESGEEGAEVELSWFSVNASASASESYLLSGVMASSLNLEPLLVEYPFEDKGSLERGAVK